MRRAKIAAGLAILAFCTVGVAVARQYYKPHPAQKLDARHLRRAQGDPRADLWIVEYLDFGSAGVAKTRRILEAYFIKHPGEIFWQTRFYAARTDTPDSLKSFIYAECAANQKKFWPFQKILFARQAEWTAAADPDRLFRMYARSCGMDLKKLSACLALDANRRAVLAEKEEAVSAGILSAPVYFVNGKNVRGAVDLQNELEVYFKDRKR